MLYKVVVFRDKDVCWAYNLTTAGDANGDPVDDGALHAIAKRMLIEANARRRAKEAA